MLSRQRLPYPFHATRPFYLDRERPEIATLYLQSASGGLYRGDSVALSIIADPHSAAHITTQASTIVHHTHKRRVIQRTQIDIGEHCFRGRNSGTAGALSRCRDPLRDRRDVG